MGKADDIIEAMENPSGKLYGGARVWFDTEKEVNTRKTDENGRYIVDYFEAIFIQHPGEPVPNVKRAKDRDKRAYPVEYKNYKDGETPPPLEGTPLIEWSMMPRSLARDLESKGIYTLEQLADLRENYGHVYDKLGPAQEWCKKAEEEIERTKKRSSTTKTNAENKKLKAEIEALRQQVRQLSQRLEMEQGPNAFNNLTS